MNSPRPSIGVDLIMSERLRQIYQKGFNLERDDYYTSEELAKAAVAYATPYNLRKNEVVPAIWPWDDSSWKTKGRIEDLAKAGALIAAEIDRLLRLEGM